MARGILRARGSVSPEPISPPPPIGQGRKISLESVSGHCGLQLADAPGESSTPCEPGRVALVWGCGDPGGAWFQNPASTLAVRGGFLSQSRMVCLDRSCPLPSGRTSLALEILFFYHPQVYTSAACFPLLSPRDTGTRPKPLPPALPIGLQHGAGRTVPSPCHGHTSATRPQGPLPPSHPLGRLEQTRDGFGPCRSTRT